MLIGVLRNKLKVFQTKLREIVSGLGGGMCSNNAG